MTSNPISAELDDPIDVVARRSLEQIATGIDGVVSIDYELVALE